VDPIGTILGATFGALIVLFFVGMYVYHSCWKDRTNCCKPPVDDVLVQQGANSSSHVQGRGTSRVVEYDHVGLSAILQSRVASKPSDAPALSKAVRDDLPVAASATAVTDDDDLYASGISSAEFQRRLEMQTMKEYNEMRGK
jgi:hypothetical protein